MPIPKEEQRRQAVWYAERLLSQKIFYFWGGDDPSGLDCSGTVVEVLQGAGRLRHGTDYTADGLYIRFKNNVVETPKAGCLKFWLSWDEDFRRDKAVHVEIFKDEHFLIGASGGGSPRLKYKDVVKEYPHLKLFPDWLVKFILMNEEARRRNAFIKSRPHTYRSGKSIILDPFL